jgi:hypothetical protein
MEDWIFDSIIEFLQSPLWSTPVLDFIDENCAQFVAEDENKFSYTEIHKVGFHCWRSSSNFFSY